MLFAAALTLSGDLIPGLFTDDPAVTERASRIWPLFALDGILIGAGDTRFLKRSMLAAFAPLAVAAFWFGFGLVGVWVALLVLMAVRLGTCGTRFAGRRWGAWGLTGRGGSTFRRSGSRGS